MDRATFQLSHINRALFPTRGLTHSRRVWHAVIIIKSLLDHSYLFSRVSDVRSCEYECIRVFEGLKYYVTGNFSLSALENCLLYRTIRCSQGGGEGGGIITWLKSLTRFFHVDVKTRTQVAGRREFSFVPTKTLQFLVRLFLSRWKLLWTLVEQKERKKKKGKKEKENWKKMLGGKNQIQIKSN